MANLTFRHITWQSPEEDKQKALDFLEDYPWSTRSRLEKPWDDEIFGIIGAFDGDRLAGTISYTISARGQGILSQVYVDDAYRKQGLATRLIDENIAAYRKYGARAVYLAAWTDWIRNMYRRVGFELAGAMGDRHAFKLTLDESGRDENLFRPGQTTAFKPMSAGIQTDITSLFNTKHPWVVKHYELGCYLGSHFEGEFYGLRNRPVVGVVPEERKVQPGFHALVLDGEETVMGFGTIIPSTRRHEGHNGTLDFLVHEHYIDRMPEMIEQLEAGNELPNLTVYIEENETRKRDVLENAGYKLMTVLPGKIRIKDDSFTLHMYGKSFG